MNNKQYITALSKALSSLDKVSKNDIVQEIQSHATESGDSLLDRFGAPEELARQYLDGEVVAKPIGAKIWGISKNVFVAIGACVVGLFAVAIVVSWWIRSDPFDYSNENAAELSTDRASWVTEQWSGELDIKINQASVAFYWHDEMNVRHDCKSKNPMKRDGSSITFTRGKCLVYLPKVPTSIAAFQSQVVMVRPQQSLQIELKQAELRMAENGTSYHYLIDAARSKVGDLSSDENADVEIRINSSEASISTYSY